MTIEDEVREFVAALPSARGADGLPDDLPLIRARIVDSLGLFRLVAFLESRYGIDIRDEEFVADNFGTIADIARLVRTKLDAAGGRAPTPAGGGKKRDAE